MPARFRSLTAKRFAAVTVGAVTAASIVALPAQAQAADGAALQKAQAATVARIQARLTTLQTLQTRVSGFKDLTSEETSTLDGVISSDTSGLTALETKVNAETTLEGVKTDAQTMIDSYRVYLLVAPKVSLTRALARETVDLAKLQKAHDTLAADLAKDPAANTQANQDLLADMQTQITAGTSRTNGQVTTLFAIQPGPDAAAISASLNQVRSAAVDTRGDLLKAASDGKTVRAALKK